MTKSLKGSNKPGLAAVLVVNLAVFAVLLATNALIFPDARRLAEQWQAGLPAALALVVCGVLNELLSPNAKARLVYWRLKDPLPGSAAFTKHAREDARVDTAVLTARLGSLPTAAKEQNVAWYRLYRTVAEEPSVVDAHRAYLFNRDCTALAALMLAPLTGIAVLRVDPATTAWLYGAALAVQYLLFSRAAANAGRRLVCTVLAVTSVQPSGPPPAAVSSGAL